MALCQVITADFSQSRSKTAGNESEYEGSKGRSGKVLDCQDFSIWAGQERKLKKLTMRQSPQDMSEGMRLLTHRVFDLGQSFVSNHYTEIVTLSARISIEALQLGLPKTASLAAELGDAKMQGHDELAYERYQKLASLVQAFCEDISLEV